MTTTPRPRPFIAVNAPPAMSGHFATLYVYDWMEGGIDIHGKPYPGCWFASPEATGFGRYDNIDDANAEGRAWAEAEGLEFHPATLKDAEQVKKESDLLRRRAARIRTLRATGLGFHEAKEQAYGEITE